MPKLKANGIEIYYEIHGEGPALVLLEGLGYASWMWDYQVKVLAEHFKVIVFDNRGVGHSEKPDAEYSIELFAEDTAALLKELGIERAHLFGISMGGFIAQEFALRYPEMVDQLILGCTSFGGPNSIPIPEETLAIMLAGGSKSGSPEKARYAVSTALNEATLQENDGIIDYIMEKQSENPQPQYAYQRQLYAGASFNSEDRVDAIAADTLILAGKGDRVVPKENAQLLHEKIPQSQVKLIDEAGHLFFMEQPEAVNQVIIDFLKDE